MPHRITAGEKLLRAIYEMQLPAISKLVVAVSGGSDSVALLWALWRARVAGLHRLDLVVAHINHQLRGLESEVDEQFVRSLAQGWDLPIIVDRIDTAAYAREHRLSIETAAREVRYRALDQMRIASDATALVAAHTIDDQAETVIMHLARGAGLDGLAGMRPRNGLLLRPFLGIKHETVLDALDEAGLAYRKDESNSSREHTRNRLRMDVMPPLEDTFPGASENIARTATLVRDDADFISQEVRLLYPSLDVRRSDSAVSFDEHVWRALHHALQSHVLRDVLSQLVRTPDGLSAAHLRLLMSWLGTAANASLDSPLPGELQARILDGRIVLSRRLEPAVRAHPTVELPVPGSVALPARGVTLVAELVPPEADLTALIAVCGGSHALCDAAALGNVLLVRSRQPGDRVRPLGGAGTRKVQDVLVDRKIRVEDRDNVVIVTNHDHIVWVTGVIQDDRTRITAETKMVVRLSARPGVHSP